MAASSSPVRARVEIPSNKNSDDEVWTMPDSIHGDGLTGQKVPLKGVNDNSSSETDDTIAVYARYIQTELNLRGDFETALRGLVDDFRTKQAEIALPDAPAREYRSRESIIDYLRSEEGFGPWAEAGALTRPLLKEKSPKAYMALANWLRNNELPADLPIPTKSEIVTAELADTQRLREASRLTSAAYRRAIKLT